ncbi:hypothetical protein CDIK_2943 [Cucumispora dikerogammari]|nr:hypothetical protein CDIK_2943 [Cucumispora dikerogammari]
MNKNCAYYKKYFSIRKNLFFSKFSLFLQKIIRIIFKWGGSSNQKEILREVNVNKNTIQKIIFKLRALCFKHNETFPIRLGGPSVICQIDESLFRHKPKNHRGRATNNKIWVFGIADTSFILAKIYLKVVENRSAAVLLLHISLVCRPGTIIHSDQWAAYNSIDVQWFAHETVNHSLYFVDPQTSVNTQTIESYWAKAKLRIKISKGVFEGTLDLFLEECMFQRQYDKRRFPRSFKIN